MQRRRPNDMGDSNAPLRTPPSPRTEYGVKSLDSQASVDQPQLSISGMQKQMELHFSQRGSRAVYVDHNVAKNENGKPGRPATPAPSAATWSLQGNDASEHNVELVVPRIALRERSKSSLTMLRDQEIGFLRLIVCGDSGIGKSTLVHALSMLPEIIPNDAYDVRDTVTVQSFVDEFDVDLEDEESRPAEDEAPNTIREVYASTMSVPDWDRQRYQEGDLRKDAHVPLYNICFIDTPGYGASLNASAAIAPVTEYLEAQFHRSNRMIHPSYPTNDTLIKFFHNRHGAHTHVDMCLYLIMGRLKKVDIEYLRSIQRLCNIVPVIVKSDLLSTDQEKELKLDVLGQLQDCGIDYFDFGYSYEELRTKASALDPSAPPFAIASLANSPKHSEDGDAACHPTSVPGRTAFARKSRLSYLKDALFYEHTERLRRSTATKFIHWRQSQAAPFPATAHPTHPLTPNEVVDRAQSVRDRKLLQISRLLNESRRMPERAITDQERDLRWKLETGDKKHAETLVAELARLFHEDPTETLSSASTTSSLDSSQRKSKSSAATSRTSRTFSVSSASLLIKPTAMDIRLVIMMVAWAVFIAALGVYIFTWITKKTNTPIYPPHR